MFSSILPTLEDRAKDLPGDNFLENPIRIDSAFDLAASPSEVFPWFVQLGKNRGGWYFTRFTESFFFPSVRGIRTIDPKWQYLKIGQRIPDYGKDGYFDCFSLEENKVIGYTSNRGKMAMTWVLSFWPSSTGTRVIIRLQISGFKKHNPIFMKFGELIDRITISWLAAGMRERLKDNI